jgi:predicted HD phosphohydrolase
MSLVAHSLSDIFAVLERYVAVEEPLAGDIPAVLVSHGVQCAEVVAQKFPDDLELQLAGLLHDIGLLLVPGDELGHPDHGSRFVRDVLGDRVGDLIALHVDAQRYLEATVEGYAVTPPPTAGAAPQPEPMSRPEIVAFEGEPLFASAVALRHADDAGSDSERRETVGGLRVWVDRARPLVAGLQARYR